MRERPAPWKRPDPLPAPLETERTLIRWYRVEDAQALHEAVDGNRAALFPWLPWASDEHASPEASRQRIEQFARDRARADACNFPLGVFERSSGALLGGTGFHRAVPERGEVEIGYWIRGDRQGEGLCTEVTAAQITAGFARWGFRRIKISCAAGNVASRRIPEKLGLRLEAHEREWSWIDGRGWDGSLTYAVLAHEWDAEQGFVRGT